MGKQQLSRRSFLTTAAGLVPAAAGWGIARPVAEVGLTRLAPSWFGAVEDLARSAPRARFWAAAGDPGVACATCHPAGQTLQGNYRHASGLVKCLLCAQGCAIKPGQRGKCRARMNVNGELRSLVYGRPVSAYVDPIEKKPFYHFLPGSSALSFGTSGCPLRCKFCQNWQLSQSSPEDWPDQVVPPTSMAASAVSRRAPVIAFTYNEPTVFTEYLLDVAGEGHKRGVRSVMVSCGFMNEAPLTEMCRALDAIKIDLKGFSEDFYRNVSGAELKPVLRSIKQVATSGRHLEIVNLVVPTLNDADQTMRSLVDWVAGELGPDVPIHFTRFHPDYQLQNLPPTPIATLDKAREMAMAKGIHYAYVGNVPGHAGNNTYCPKCKRVVIARDNFFVTSMDVKDGKCRFCGQPIAGVWS